MTAGRFKVAGATAAREEIRSEAGHLLEPDDGYTKIGLAEVGIAAEGGNGAREGRNAVGGKRGECAGVGHGLFGSTAAHEG